MVVLSLGCRCLPSVNTICGRVMIWLSLLSSGRPSVNTICGHVMIGLSLLSSVSKHTMWSYYDCIYCCFRSSVNTICGRIMIGFIVVVVRQ